MTYVALPSLVPLPFFLLLAGLKNVSNLDAATVRGESEAVCGDGGCTSAADAICGEVPDHLERLGLGSSRKAAQEDEGGAACG